MVRSLSLQLKASVLQKAILGSIFLALTKLGHCCRRKKKHTHTLCGKLRKRRHHGDDHRFTTVSVRIAIPQDRPLIRFPSTAKTTNANRKLPSCPFTPPRNRVPLYRSAIERRQKRQATVDLPYLIATVALVWCSSTPRHLW